MIGARARVALALCLPLAGLVETLASLVIAARVPQASDWAAARPVIDAQRRAGDVVVVAPRWAEPHARAALGDATFPLSDLARADDTRVARALVLTLGEHRDPDLRGFVETARTPLGGGLSLRVLANPQPARVVSDLLALVDAGSARIAQRREGHDYPCTYSEHAVPTAAGLFGQPALGPRQWVCGADPALNAGPTVVDDQAFRPRRCLLAPIAPGARTVVRFADVALGAVLRGHGGVSWTRQRERKGAPVVVEIRLDDASLAEIVHPEGGGFAPFSVPLGARTGTRGTIELVLSTQDGSARPYCLEADTRD